MLNEESLSSFLKYAGHDLPELTYRLQQLANVSHRLGIKEKSNLSTN
jgi:hypothetical protein